jgi:CheY-like chemotaxis protein
MSYVLLVEDSQSNADMVIRLLQSVNIKVQHTTHGLSAAKIAHKERPDLILLDFNLPDIDGRTLILTLRKQLGGPQAPPIVALTARASESEKQIAQRFGFSAFISKPFVPDEFLELIQQLLKIK